MLDPNIVFLAFPTTIFVVYVKTLEPSRVGVKPKFPTTKQNNSCIEALVMYAMQSTPLFKNLEGFKVCGPYSIIHLNQASILE